ncbi:hypothetical protein UlMin_018247 [Ulmus minor]
MGYVWLKKSKINCSETAVVEMIVHMDCTGCETKIKKALRNLEGVNDVDVDMKMQKVTVTGWVDREKALKIVKKTGRKAELWPYPCTAEYKHNVAMQQYCQPNDEDHQHALTTAYHSSQPSISYTYFQNSYLNGHDYISYQEQAPYSCAATSMFSDDNPHACSIM